jgi:hypothetical protein
MDEKQKGGNAPLFCLGRYSWGIGQRIYLDKGFRIVYRYIVVIK